jgi:hypothetical protein
MKMEQVILMEKNPDALELLKAGLYKMESDIRNLYENLNNLMLIAEHLKLNQEKAGKKC